MNVHVSVYPHSKPPTPKPNLQVTAKLKPRKGHEEEEEEDPLPFLFMTSHFESLADPVHAKERWVTRVVCVKGARSWA